MNDLFNDLFAVFSTVTPDELAFICQKFGVISKPGVQPDTRQAVIYSPDGTPALYFIAHISPVASPSMTTKLTQLFTIKYKSK